MIELFKGIYNDHWIVIYQNFNLNADRKWIMVAWTQLCFIGFIGTYRNFVKGLLVWYGLIFHILLECSKQNITFVWWCASIEMKNIFFILCHVYFSAYFDLICLENVRGRKVHCHVIESSHLNNAIDKTIPQNELKIKISHLLQSCTF